MDNGEKSFRKLFDILELISGGRTARRVNDISTELGLPASTVYRMLKFLSRRGYVERTSGGFILGPGCMRLGGMAQEQNLLPVLAHPELANLAETTLETVHLARIQGNRVLYVDKIEGGRAIRMGSVVGLSAPLHCTGIGKAMLAALTAKELEERLPLLELTRFTEKTICDREALLYELEAIRARGYAVDDCEHELGVYCIAAAVRDSRGRAVAGVSVAGSPICMKPNADALAERVCAAAERISAKL